MRRAPLMIAVVLSTGCLPDLDFPADTSAPEFTVDLALCDFSVSEIGDAFSNSENLGLLSIPVTICGSLYGTGNSQAEGESSGTYSSDMDFIQFAVSEGAGYNFTMNWEEETGDYDLYLFDQNYDEVERSTAEKPEEFNAYLSADADHFFVIAGWDGLPGKWQIDIVLND